MKGRDIISSIFWMIIGIGVCYGGYDLEMGTLHDPGSGFIFFWVGIIMIGLVRKHTHPGDKGKRPFREN